MIKPPITFAEIAAVATVASLVVAGIVGFATAAWWLLRTLLS